MRLLITLIDWQYPSAKEEVENTVWDINDQNTLLALILTYGNGTLLELRAEGENEDAIDGLRSIAIGTGASHKIELSLAEQQNLWLYQAGDECYKQPMDSGGYTFINPTPQPDKFSRPG
jgi:hypothetical protein